MRLSEYFKKHNINQREFSEEHCLNYTYLRMIACGASVPSLRLAIKISKATEGQVSPVDLLPEEYQTAETKTMKFFE
jgi:transcriptional regulator with XRE-family HTH domain